MSAQRGIATALTGPEDEGQCVDGKDVKVALWVVLHARETLHDAYDLALAS